MLKSVIIASFLLFKLSASQEIYPPILIPRVLKPKAGGSFSYSEGDQYGPSKWNLLNSVCDGVQQSPINIETTDVYKGKEPAIVMDYFVKPVSSIVMTNSGHSVNFRLIFADDQPNRLFWNGETYLLDSLHFHWGNFCEGGSEHTVNGHRYAAEVHLVHFNAKYGNIGAAINEPDGLAVVGVFFETAEESNNDGSNDNRFVKYLDKVRNVGQSFTITNSSGIFSVRQLLKNYVNEYYSYKGSLTTPPCSQSVRWIVSKKPVKIYPSEIAELSKLMQEGGSFQTINYRPLQKLNGRIVYDYNYSATQRLRESQASTSPPADA